MKKIRVLLMTICMLMATISSYMVFADTTASISVGSATGKTGETVAIAVSLQDLPDVSGVTIKVVDYDASKIKLVSANDTGFLKDLVSDKTSVLTWGLGLSKCNTGKAGTVVTFNFQLLSGFTTGTTEICFVAEVYSMDKETTQLPLNGMNAEYNGDKPCVKTTITAKEHEHEVDKWTMTKAPTCTEEGEEKGTCYCGTTITRSVKPGHTVGIWETIKEATCTENGSAVLKCSVCGSKIKEKEISAKNHTYGEWIITKEASCTQEGEKQRSCKTTGCNDVETAVVEKISHTYSGKEEVVKGATCAEDGSKKVFCSVASCESYETVKIPATGHVKGETKVEKEATCTEKGKKVVLCKECDAVISTETIKALGHKYGEVKMEKEATCTEDGYGYKTCERCEDSQKVEYDALGHKFGKAVVDREASCTEDGYGHQSCERCDESKEVKYEKLGHEYGEAVVAVEATCTEKGASYKPCVRCDESQDMEIPALGHEYGELVVEVEATCTTAGAGYKPCSRCTDAQLAEIPALGHQYSESVVIKEATVSEEGESQAVCEVCNDSITEIWPKLSETHEHKFSEEQKVVEEAACTQKGIAHVSCTVEGCEAYKILETPELGHTFGEWEIIKESTVEEEGTKKRVCSVCQYEEELSIEKLPEVPDDELDQKSDVTSGDELDETQNKEMITIIFFGILAVIGVVLCIGCIFRMMK